MASRHSSNVVDRQAVKETEKNGSIGVAYDIHCVKHSLFRHDSAEHYSRLQGCFNWAVAPLCCLSLMLTN